MLGRSPGPKRGQHLILAPVPHSCVLTERLWLLIRPFIDCPGATSLRLCQNSPKEAAIKQRHITKSPNSAACLGRPASALHSVGWSSQSFQALPHPHSNHLSMEAAMFLTMQPDFLLESMSPGVGKWQNLSHPLA